MMRTRHACLAAALLAAALPACQPPPSGAATVLSEDLSKAAAPSEPLPSPDTSNAIWAQSSQPMRLVYGVPGQPVLVSLECLGAGTPGAQLRIARHAPADRNASALLALIGNRRVARVEVDATEQGGKLLWQGKASAALPGWDAFADPVDATMTVPGAGLVRLNASPLPVELVTKCRGAPPPPGPARFDKPEIAWPSVY